MADAVGSWCWLGSCSVGRGLCGVAASALVMCRARRMAVRHVKTRIGCSDCDRDCVLSSFWHVLGFCCFEGFSTRTDTSRDEEAKNMFVSSYMQTMAYVVRCYMHAIFKKTLRYASEKP